MKAYLGIDIGTSKICVLVIDGNTKKTIKVISEQIKSAITSPYNYFEQDPYKIKAITLRLVKQIKKRLRCKIMGIGITGQMHGMLFIDDNLKPLSNLITWQDKRSMNLIKEIQKKLENIEQKRTGCRINPGYMAATLYWHIKNNCIPKNAYKACFVQDWIAACISSSKNIYTDPTDAASSGIFNIKTIDWQ